MKKNLIKGVLAFVGVSSLALALAPHAEPATAAPSVINPFSLNKGFTTVNDYNYLVAAEVNGAIAAKTLRIAGWSWINENYNAPDLAEYPLPIVDSQRVRLFADEFSQYSNGDSSLSIEQAYDDGNPVANDSSRFGLVKIVNTDSLQYQNVTPSSGSNYGWLSWPEDALDLSVPDPSISGLTGILMNDVVQPDLASIHTNTTFDSYFDPLLWTKAETYSSEIFNNQIANSVIISVNSDNTLTLEEGKVNIVNVDPTTMSGNYILDYSPSSASLSASTLLVFNYDIATSTNYGDPASCTITPVQFESSLDDADNFANYAPYILHNINGTYNNTCDSPSNLVGVTFSGPSITGSVLVGNYDPITFTDIPVNIETDRLNGQLLDKSAIIRPFTYDGWPEIGINHVSFQGAFTFNTIDDGGSESGGGSGGTPTETTALTDPIVAEDVQKLGLLNKPLVFIPDITSTGTITNVTFDANGTDTYTDSTGTWSIYSEYGTYYFTFTPVQDWTGDISMAYSVTDGDYVTGGVLSGRIESLENASTDPGFYVNNPTITGTGYRNADYSTKLEYTIPNGSSLIDAIFEDGSTMFTNEAGTWYLSVSDSGVATLRLSPSGNVTDGVYSIDYYLVDDNYNVTTGNVAVTFSGVLSSAPVTRVDGHPVTGGNLLPLSIVLSALILIGTGTAIGVRKMNEA